jgi:tetratricopeptide (TPR) repeat protein
LADSYALLGSMPAAVIPPKVAGAKAKEAAQKALVLDGTLAEAEVSLAFAIYSFDWDWATGEAHFRRAIALDPENVAAHYWYALYLGQMGRLDEALHEAQRALELEPLSLLGTYAVGLAHYSARRFDLARQYAEQALEISPEFPLAARLLGKVESAEGRYAEAVEHCRRQYDRAPDNSMSAALLAHAYARAGELTKARQIMNDLVRQAAATYVSPVNIAFGFIGLDDKDAAFSWLEKGYAERSQGLTFLNNEPIFDPLRSDPRFASLVRRVGLPL